MIVGREIRRALLEHARAELPNEACGVLVVRDGAAVEYLPGRNAAASPVRFQLELDPEDWLRLEGKRLVVFHSHTRSDEWPSATDLLHAGGDPLLILSLPAARFGLWRGRTRLPLLFAA